LAHTDQLQSLLSALKDIQGLCRERLTKDEFTWLLEAHNTLDDVLTGGVPQDNQASSK
jgi:hypothetical protein